MPATACAPSVPRTASHGIQPSAKDTGTSLIACSKGKKVQALEEATQPKTSSACEFWREADREHLRFVETFDVVLLDDVLFSHWDD